MCKRVIKLYLYHRSCFMLLLNIRRVLHRSGLYSCLNYLPPRIDLNNETELAEEFLKVLLQASIIP